MEQEGNTGWGSNECVSTGSVAGCNRVVAAAATYTQQLRAREHNGKWAGRSASCDPLVAGFWGARMPSAQVQESAGSGRRGGGGGPRISPSLPRLPSRQRSLQGSRDAQHRGRSGLNAHQVALPSLAGSSRTRPHLQGIAAPAHMPGAHVRIPPPKGVGQLPPFPASWLPVAHPSGEPHWHGPSLAPAHLNRSSQQHEPAGGQRGRRVEGGGGGGGGGVNDLPT